MMKKLTFATISLIATLAISASGQVKPGVTESNHAASIGPSATRVGVLGARPETTSDNVVNTANAQPRAIPDLSLENRIVATPSSSATVGSLAAVPTAAIAMPLTQVYRVGVGDVLDIQLPDNPGNQSTLFSVLEGGLLDYPLAGDPVSVGGLTTAEVAAHLRERIKVLESPAVAVIVRDYASHSVTITGFVGAPGLKILRREAVPLYVLLSEAMPFSEAARATIIRQGRPPVDLDLAESNASSTLVVPGDVIKVSGMPPAPTEFFFVGGEINSPGQKPYYSGLTLTQAILASGGCSKNAGIKVRLSRQRADGRLVTSEYNLSNIQRGEIPDPALQKGDRLEISAAQ
jgi:protein involved in polysaccharide export with SLBB domain